MKEGSHLLKPTIEFEADFYENAVTRLPALVPFMPKYFGRRSVDGSSKHIRLIRMPFAFPLS